MIDIKIALRARDSFDAYRSLEYEKFGGANNARSQEIIKRLRQLLWLIEQVISICQHSTDRNRQMLETQAEITVGDGLDLIEIHDRVELHTETFYWIAHRTAEVIRGMPGLKPFKAVGVRDVRNWLLEHVEKPGGSTSVGFGWGASAGPDGVIRESNGPTIATPVPGRDKGLYRNATEFFAELERVTRRCTLHPELIT